MPELTELNEVAINTWIQNTVIHGQTVGIVPRRYKQVKFDDDGNLDLKELPSVVTQAKQDRMLHTKVAVWLFNAEITLEMQADDTNQAAWDAAATALEIIFSVDDLAGYLTASVAGYLCRGIVSRNMGQTVTEDRHWKRTYALQMWASRDTP